MDEENEEQFLIIENFAMRKKIAMLKTLYFAAVCLFASLVAADAQEKPSDAKIKETAPKRSRK
jgi:hypothetical protein